MPDPIKDDKKEEVKDPDQYDVKTERNLTFSQIVEKQQKEREKLEADKKEDEKPDTEVVKDDKPTDEEVAKQKQLDAETAEKRQAELAAKTAAEVVEKQRLAEEDRKAKEQQALDAEKKRQEALKPKFTGVDKDGNPLPKSYDEIAAESARIAKEEATAEIRAELAEKEAKAKETQDQEAKVKADKEAATKAFNEGLQKEMDADLNAIYKANDLPKIKVEIKDASDPTDPGFSDPGYKEREHLFKTAVKVNSQRMAKGQPLIRSIQMIRYGKDPETGKAYYTPLTKQVAGHNAPVFGNESSQSEEISEKYNIKTDRNKSYAQIIREERQRLASKANVRNVN